LIYNYAEFKERRHRVSQSFLILFSVKLCVFSP
jgi:hypothetical protein